LYLADFHPSSAVKEEEEEEDEDDDDDKPREIGRERDLLPLRLGLTSLLQKMDQEESDSKNRVFLSLGCWY